MFVKLNRENGFTLIELLVVIAIIGILSSVVLASLNTARQKSRDARRVSDMKQIQLALELSFDSSGNSYPVQALGGVPASLATDGFIAVIPAEPSAGRQAYQYIGTANDYCVGADMEGTPPSPADTCISGATISTTAIDYSVGP